jgi:hypothetical protein
MLIEIPREIRKKGKIIFISSIPVLGFVWTYLEKVLPITSKQDIDIIYLIQLSLTALIIIVILIVFIYLILKHITNIKSISPVELNKYKNPIRQRTHDEQLTYELLSNILFLRGINEAASPSNIADRMNLDPGTVLERLNIIHDDQVVTFQSGGLPPDFNTNFFLSEKAFQIISINDTQQVAAPDREELPRSR